VTNKNVKKYKHIFQKFGRGIFMPFLGARVGVATWVNDLAMRLCFYNLYAESQTSRFNSSWDLDIYTDWRTWPNRLGYWSWLKIYVAVFRKIAVRRKLSNTKVFFHVPFRTRLFFTRTLITHYTASFSCYSFFYLHFTLHWAKSQVLDCS